MPKKGRPPRMSEQEFMSKTAVLLLGGATLQEIADACGLPSTTTYEMLKR